MKVGKAIEFVDAIKPNAFTEAQKTKWLSDCEGMVQTQVLLFAPAEVIFYAWPEDKEIEMLVQPPHDKLYLSYLCALIDFANGEYDRYQNSMQVFNAEFSEFVRWFARTYRPADTNTEREEGLW